MKNPINQIVIEGPDLSGKTTLYQNIHDKTDYRWNIQDRSALSMLVHAKYYGRSEFQHVESLKKELSNLNNFIILLLPSWEIIADRFTKRGDKIQNLASLRKIYLLFDEAASEFEHYPNVYVLRKEINENILKLLVANLIKFENMCYPNIASMFFNHCLATKKDESIGVSLTSYVLNDDNYKDIDFDYLVYEKEIDYYRLIKKTLLKKIDNELIGANEYERIEDFKSRRFIYASNTCISLAHFMCRNNMLDCKFFIRSSNTKDTLKYDLNFIKYLSKCVKEKLEEYCKINFVKLDLIINSAHIPSSI